MELEESPSGPDVDSFLASKRAKVNASNQEEFIDTITMENTDASRTKTKALCRTDHIVSSVVDNQDGPLSRSVISSTSGKLISPHGYEQHGSTTTGSRLNLEERVRNIETHMGIVVSPLERTLVDRIKVLEDKILKIEQFYPQIAAHVFNYGKAEVEASSRPGGRVSKVPGSGAHRRRARDQAAPENDEQEESVQQGSPRSDVTNELRKKILQLRNRLRQSSEAS